MPTCQNCGKGWTWKQTLRVWGKMKCPYCSEKQYETTSSRQRTLSVSMLPLIILPINALFDFGWIIFTALVLLCTIVTISAYPFLLKLSNEQEPLW